MIISTVTKIGRRIAEGDISYFVGRFYTARRCYSYLRHLREFASAPAQQPSESERPTLFPGVNVEVAFEAMCQSAVYLDPALRLPADVTAEIEAFARAEPLHPACEPHGRTFFHDDIKQGYTKDGLITPLGGVREPTRCAAVQRVVSDPILREIVRRYLGYEPTRVLPLLTWSFASQFADEERRQRNQTIDYHYDVFGFNFVYIYFYLLDTDRHSGAHVMMKGSHKRKPLRMLLGSVIANEDDVRQHFGVENELIIEGPAGTGFFEDAACFHRATPPTERDRLTLAIRFT